MTPEFSQQIFEKSSNIKSHEYMSRGSWVFPCKQTEMMKLIVTSCNFVNVPNNRNELHTGPSRITYFTVVQCNNFSHNLKLLTLTGTTSSKCADQRTRNVNEEKTYKGKWTEDWLMIWSRLYSKGQDIKQKKSSQT